MRVRTLVGLVLVLTMTVTASATAGPPQSPDEYRLLKGTQVGGSCSTEFDADDGIVCEIEPVQREFAFRLRWNNAGSAPTQYSFPFQAQNDLDPTTYTVKLFAYHWKKHRYVFIGERTINATPTDFDVGPISAAKFRRKGAIQLKVTGRGTPNPSHIGFDVFKLAGL